MKKGIMKISGLALAGVLSLGSMTTAFAAEAAEEPAAPAVTMEDLAGTYVELFPEFEKEEYKPVWITRLQESAGLDEESAELAREMLIGMMEAEVYGEEAIGLAAEEPGYSMFDCFFINGPVQITVDGDTISGTDEEGNEVFSHTYVFDETMKADFGEMNAMYEEMISEGLFSEEDWPTMDVYVAEDADDDFKYFAFMGDTPAETYHIEFRYGADKEGLASYYDGDYAYWLAAGIPADYSEELITDCINLFVDENAPSIAEMFTAEDAAAEEAAAE